LYVLFQQLENLQHGMKGIQIVDAKQATTINHFMNNKSKMVE
jgi:hypothetical protein